MKLTNNSVKTQENTSPFIEFLWTLGLMAAMSQHSFIPMKEKWGGLLQEGEEIFASFQNVMD